MMEFFDFVKTEKYDELVVAIHEAFEEIRADNKLSKEHYDSELKKLNECNHLAEAEQKVLKLEKEVVATKQILTQLSALVERLIKEKPEEVKKEPIAKEEKIEIAEVVPEESPIMGSGKKDKGGYTEVYPKINDDCASCIVCMKWIKISEATIGKSTDGRKMTEGRCPLCKNYVVRIV